MNSVPPNSTYFVEVFVNTYGPEEFYEGQKSQTGKKKGKKPKIEESVPYWAMYNLTYTMGDPERNNHEFYYDLDLDYLK
jgi:hypothetical protein